MVDSIREGFLHRGKRYVKKSSGFRHTIYFNDLFLYDTVLNKQQCLSKLLMKRTFKCLFANTIPCIIREFYHINLRIWKKRSGSRLKNISPTFLGFVYSGRVLIIFILLHRSTKSVFSAS